MTRVASLTGIFDHLLNIGLVDDGDWLRLRAQAQSRAVVWPDQSEDDQADAWARGSLPDHEYRSARLHLDLKEALRAQAGESDPDVLNELDSDLHARVAVYEAEQVAAVRAALTSFENAEPAT